MATSDDDNASIHSNESATYHWLHPLSREAEEAAWTVPKQPTAGDSIEYFKAHFVKLEDRKRWSPTRVSKLYNAITTDIANVSTPFQSRYNAHWDYRPFITSSGQTSHLTTDRARLVLRGGSSGPSWKLTVSRSSTFASTICAGWRPPRRLFAFWCSQPRKKASTSSHRSTTPSGTHRSRYGRSGALATLWLLYLTLRREDVGAEPRLAQALAMKASRCIGATSRNSTENRWRTGFAVSTIRVTCGSYWFSVLTRTGMELLSVTWRTGRGMSIFLLPQTTLMWSRSTVPSMDSVIKYSFVFDTPFIMRQMYSLTYE